MCPHRFATLTDRPTGQCDRLICQYHGWEFDETGNTRKIPDAVNFRPLEKGKLGLTEFATAVVGNLIFVNLGAKPTTIEDYFGDQLDYVKDYFGGPRKLLFRVDQAHEANWKIVIENALESYHVSMVHANTFGTTAKAEACHHVLDENYTKFIEDLSNKTDRVARQGKRLLDFIDYPLCRDYQHLLVYPCGMLTSMPPFSLIQWPVPISPTRSISRWAVLGYGDESPTIRLKLVMAFLSLYAKRFFPRLLEEDRGVQEAVQRGLQSPQIPAGGLISAREERIYHFQRMIASATQLPLPPDIEGSDVKAAGDRLTMEVSHAG